MDENSINHLTDIGFELVGEWVKSDNKSERIEFQIRTYLEKSDLLYAFESNNIIYYIGKTDKTLKSRMTNYKAGVKDGSGGNTNKVVHENIIKLLNHGSIVNIYVLLDKLENDYKGYKISLASGIEMSLISSFNSDILWNSRGTKKKIIKTGKSINLIANKTEISSNTFLLNLSKEYYHKGIISFPIRFKDYLPKISGIDVRLKIEDQKITYSTYTISGETRKINGKETLINWFGKFNLGDKIKVEIESPLDYKITKV